MVPEASQWELEHEAKAGSRGDLAIRESPKQEHRAKFARAQAGSPKGVLDEIGE